MLKRLLLISLFTLVSGSALAAGVDGLIVKFSPYSVTQTMDRFENVLKQKGIMVVARLSHDANADKVGIQLSPTHLILFGNPMLGSHFFTSRQTAGIDLPMKVLVWEDAQGKVWLGYNDPIYIANRHGITDRNEIVGQMTGVLNNLTNAALTK
ncbi:MAG: DUF302 domain-containing protein [Moraxellaceae bacterium]|uniref:DUF302 domain-containing protein n=1 Tax=Limnobacter sp. TaxID=2003368 RepID=UPI0027357CE7|nr:DUF302 domain-containing protein [Limnobacter sp.]MDP3189069.1 DUF302 domain-containing protein [Limnobacter sp.]MDZ4298144.1 DUF302 domain-containing protein [Moraxellaceae bacterium]